MYREDVPTRFQGNFNKTAEPNYPAESRDKIVKILIEI